MINTGWLSVIEYIPRAREGKKNSTGPSLKYVSFLFTHIQNLCFVIPMFDMIQWLHIHTLIRGMNFGVHKVSNK